MDTDEVLKLLQIAHLAKDWPESKPLHDRALRKLKELGSAPVEESKLERPVSQFRRPTNG